MTTQWRMTAYDVDLNGRATELAGGWYRFIYTPDSHIRITTAGAELELRSDEGLFIQEAAQITGTGTVWVFEVGCDGQTMTDDASRSIILSRQFRPEFSAPWLLRADRIESAPGSATPRHGHRGPGIRRLVKGCLLAQINDDYERINSGHAWFETGRDPVIGTNIYTGNSAFVRVMVLPIELQGGKSSFVPTTAEDASKPRAVVQRLFGEIVIGG